MKRISIIILLIAFTFSGFSQNFIEYEFSFKIKDRSELEQLTNIISIENVKGETVYASANDIEFEKFKTLAYKYTIIPKVRDSKYIIEMAATVSEMNNWDKYPTYEVYCKMMQDFAKNYPSICKIDTIGTSVEGRHLLAVKISDNVNLNEAEPEFFYTSTMHGDETTGFILMLRLIDSLVSNYGNVTEITELINNTEIYINPNANPDATYAGGNNNVSSATRRNANGINLNRNFPDPDNGPHPDGYAWQPETMAMMEYAKRKIFVLSANFHGGAEVINYPWDTWSRSHVDENWFQDICYTYANSVQANGPAGYFTDVRSSGVVNGYDWYVIAGGRQDYMLYYENCRELTIELSSVKLLSSDLLNAHWDYNKEALFLFIKDIQTGLRGIVKDENGNPLEAMITIENHDSNTDSSMVFSNADHGDYYRLIKSGTYSITASAKNYIPLSKNNIEIKNDDITNLNFTLKLKPTITLTGTVLDNDSQIEVDSVQVIIYGATNDTIYTNTNGQYSFMGYTDTEYTVRYAALGYSSSYENIIITKDNPTFSHTIFKAQIEDFEQGNLLSYNWTHSGDSNWLITDSIKYSGTYSIKSGKIDNNEKTTIAVNLEIIKTSDIEFYKKISAESSYDGLEFYIDDTKIKFWNGENDWTKESFKVNPGIHNFKWIYKKDNTGDAGLDCAWIDSIIFPIIASDKAIISCNTDSIKDDFTSACNGSKYITITNQGKGILQFTAEIIDTEKHNWISLTNNSGLLAYQESHEIRIDYILVDQDSTYNCNILFTDQINGNDTIVPVNFTVKKLVSVDQIYKPIILKVYPNPFKEEFSIDFHLNKLSNVRYQLINVHGQIIYSSQKMIIPAGKQQIQVKNSLKNNAGSIIFLKLIIDNEEYHQKLIQY